MSYLPVFNPCFYTYMKTTKPAIEAVTPDAIVSSLTKAVSNSTYWVSLEDMRVKRLNLKQKERMPQRHEDYSLTRQVLIQRNYKRKQNKNVRTFKIVTIQATAAHSAEELCQRHPRPSRPATPPNDSSA